MESLDRYRNLVGERAKQRVREKANEVIARMKKRAYDGFGFGTIHYDNSTFAEEVMNIIRATYNEFLTTEHHYNKHSIFKVYWDYNEI